MELIIALFIGTIVLLITFSFVTDTVAELAKSRKKSDFLTHYYDFVEIFKNQKNTYIEPVVIVDTTEWSGNDVILLKNTDNTWGVLFWVVNTTTMLLDSAVNFNTYASKVFGYVYLSESQVSSILWTPSNVYSITFFEDKLFTNLQMKTLQAEVFQGGDIINIDATFNTNYRVSLDGESFTDIPVDDFLRLAVSF